MTCEQAFRSDSWPLILVIKFVKQECIPVGCGPSAAVAVSPTTHAAMHGSSMHAPLPCTLLLCTPPATHAPCHTCPCHACPLPCMLPCHTCPLPCMPLLSCTMPPAMHAPPLPHMPSHHIHTPCHTHPQPHTPPTMHTPLCIEFLTHTCQNITFPQQGNKGNVKGDQLHVTWHHTTRIHYWKVQFLTLSSMLIWTVSRISDG